MKHSPQFKRILLKSLEDSGRLVQKGFGRTQRIRKKTPISLVTDVDMASDDLIRKIIKKNFPDHGILTEESKPHESPSPYRWIIDPIDGTTNFAHGIPLCCVSIGLEFEGKMILGGVYNPIHEELFFAEKGKGATLNGKRIRVSTARTLIESLIVTGFPYDSHEKADYYLRFFKILLAKCLGIRRLGAAALDLAYVACGRFEAFWELNLQPWDVAAGVLIVEEAGGKVSDYKGLPFDVNHPLQLLASNGRAHEDILAELKKAL